MLAPMIVTSTNSPAAEAREVEVGSFLPPAPSDPSFVLFKATTKDTPALRAGIITIPLSDTSAFVSTV